MATKVKICLYLGISQFPMAIRWTPRTDVQITHSHITSSSHIFCHCTMAYFVICYHQNRQNWFLLLFLWLPSGGSNELQNDQKESYYWKEQKNLWKIVLILRLENEFLNWELFRECLPTTIQNLFTQLYEPGSNFIWPIASWSWFWGHC